MSLDVPLHSLSLHLYRDRLGRWRASLGDPGERVAFGPSDSVTAVLAAVGYAIVHAEVMGGRIEAPSKRPPHARTRFAR